MEFLQKVGRLGTRTMLKRKLSKQASISSEIAEVPPKTSRAEGDPPSESDQSKYFQPSTPSFPEKFISIQLELNYALKPLQFKSPVAYVYNPVEYAFKANESYVKKYCQGPKKLLFVGMNPGLDGMCQTGVPFGEIKSVRDWLGICEEVGKPEKECRQKPVLGFACKKSEPSGDRLWNVLKKLVGTPDVFFKNCFVYNYCPLAFLRESGGNLTPRDFKETKLLEEICDRYFFQVIQLLSPEIIIGIGEYAEKRSLATLKDNSCTIKVIRLPHPSPRAANNQNWPEKAEKFFETHDLLKYMTE